MIKKVEINLNDKSLVRFFDESTEQSTLKECNEFLAEHDASDGQTMMSFEDYIAVNSHLAKKFNDPYNFDYYMEYDDDAVEDAIIYIADRFCEHHWSEKMLKDMLTSMGQFNVTEPTTPNAHPLPKNMNMITFGLTSDQKDIAEKMLVLDKNVYGSYELEECDGEMVNVWISDAHSEGDEEYAEFLRAALASEAELYTFYCNVGGFRQAIGNVAIYD